MATSSKVRILIADDHSIVADGLRSLLDKDHEVIGVVRDGRELIATASTEKPDVIVLDISMPLLNGLDAAERLQPSLPNVKFVFLTMKDDRNLAAAALDLGAVGYVLKKDATSELLKALSEVLQGRPYVTQKLRPENWAEQEARAHQYSKDLTPRQEEIVQLLAEGRSMKEIAGILTVSEKTVEFHKYHIMQAYNLKSNAEIVLFAVKRHLIS